MSDFHLLLKGQIPSLVRHASALTRDPDQAGDLVEDTVREALASQRDWRLGSDFRVWLLSIMYDQRHNPFRIPTPAVNESGAVPDQALLTLTALDHAMGQLTEEQRAVILLIGLERMTYDATAAVLRIPIGTMRTRLSNGREALRRALGSTEEVFIANAA